MLDQLEDVWPLQRIAAGEHGQRPLGKLIQQIEQLLSVRRGEIPGVTPRLRTGAAVLARQVAGPRHLVKHHERPVLEIGAGVGRRRSGR
jgi:hypothetical protein